MTKHPDEIAWAEGGDTGVGTLDIDRFAVLCKALGHPHRVRIVAFLASQERCYAGEIVDHLPIAPSTVSRHLSLLKSAGLISGRVEGPRRCYCIEPGVLDEIRGLLAGLEALLPPVAPTEAECDEAEDVVA